MSEPVWLEINQALLIQQKMIGRFGGSHGIRDEGLLQSALMRPKNLYFYEDGSVFDCAAVYAEGIAQNHPFIDGNKRTAFSTAGLFLRENGFFLRPQEGTNHEDIIVTLATKQINYEELASYLEAQCQ